MAFETPKRISMWSFGSAPPEFQRLFPEGEDTDWLAFVPHQEREVIESSLLRWKDVYPVRAAELPDRSVVYWGAPRGGLRSIIERGKPLKGKPPSGKERRGAVRVQMVYPSRYETHSKPAQTGLGHTIDMSDAGIAFTTESLLPVNAAITLYVTWPVRLEGDVPIELRAAGRLARTDAMKAALRLDTMSFSLAE